MKRHLAIGDIHGCSEALQSLCDFIEIREDDTVITLGDYSNRGPNSKAVIDGLIHLKNVCDLHPLRGNHDIMMLDARQSETEFQRWLEVGGDRTLRSYAPCANDPGTLGDIPEHHWLFLENLLPFFETESHFFVHANAYPEIPLTEQPDYMLYWEPYDNPPVHASGKVMICGHTSQKSGVPAVNSHSACIDTWACGEGWLSCLHVESGLIWQANQRRETRRLWLDEIRSEDAMS